MLSLIALQVGHPTVSPNSSMSCLVIHFPQNSCPFKLQWKDDDRVHSNIWSVNCLSAVSHSPKYFNYTLDGFLVPSALLISRALNTPSALPMKHSALLLRIPSQIPNLYLRFILFMGSVELCFANTCSPNGTNSCIGLFPVFRTASSRQRPF